MWKIVICWRKEVKLDNSNFIRTFAITLQRLPNALEDSFVLRVGGGGGGLLLQRQDYVIFLVDTAVFVIIIYL